MSKYRKRPVVVDAEHRWLSVRLPVADKELWWLQPAAVGEEERAAAIDAEREACKVRVE